MQQLFKTPEDQSEFEQKGFLIKEIEPGVIDRLADIYKLVKPMFFHQTMYFNLLKDNAKNRKADNAIRKLFENFMDGLFTDYSCDLGCFVTKRFHNKWDLGLHQDWTMTNEDEAHSVLMWVPLHDVTVKNGCITVFEGSHIPFANSLRSFYVPSVYISVYDERFIPFQTKIELKKGEILIFSHALFHGSMKNSTWKNRVTSMISVFPKNSPKIFHSLKDNMVHKLRIDREFHFKYQPFLKDVDLTQHYEVLESRPLSDHLIVTEDMMLAHLKAQAVPFGK